MKFTDIRIKRNEDLVTATAEPTTEYSLDLTNEDINAAFPTFYGQVVRAKHYFPKEGSDRHRIVMQVKPYNPEIQVNKEKGTVGATYWFTDENKNKPYTDYFKLRKNLKDSGVEGGNPEKAVGKELWWKMSPPQNGYDRPMQPTSKPKDATVPPRPADWDLEAWIAEFGQEAEENESTTPSGTELLPETLHATLIGFAIGEAQGSPKIIQKAMRDSAFKEYDMPTVTRTLASLVEAGSVRVENGTYTQ